MYALFYLGYLIFGGIGGALTIAGGVNAVRQYEEKTKLKIELSRQGGYWEGFGTAWPVAYRQGQENMLQVCQSLAMETAQMMEMGPPDLFRYGQLVNQWDQFALPQQEVSPWPFPEVASLGMSSGWPFRT